VLYAGRLSGWHKNWDDAVLNCPNAAVGALLYTLLAMFITVITVPAIYILCVPPPERGRELISQAEMNADANTDSNDGLRAAADGSDKPPKRM